MKKYSRKQKFLLLLTSSAIGASVYAAAYSLNSAEMTEWQRAQKIDFKANTGATKFKAQIDSLSAGGIAFCLSAAAIIALKKLTEKK